MEQKMVPPPLADGIVVVPLSPADVVHYVLTKDNRKPTFLKNIGVHASTSRPTKAHLESQLQAERAASEKLRESVELQKSKEAAEAERLKYEADMQEMRRTQEEMQKK